MISTETVVERIEINADGSVGVLIGKIVSNSGNVISSGKHRILIPAPTAEVPVAPDEVLAANNAWLQEAGFPAISQADQAKIMTATTIGGVA